MRKNLRIFLAILLVACTAGGAFAIPLPTLLQGGSITSGGLLFDQWYVSSYTASDPSRSFNPATVNVVTVESPGGSGIAINTGTELMTFGDGVYGFVDLMFGFRVSTLTAGSVITGSQLFIASGYESWTEDDDYDLGMYVKEDLGTAAGLDDLGTLAAEISRMRFPGGSPTVTNNNQIPMTFGGVTELYATKNAIAWAVDPTDAMGIFQIQQLYNTQQNVATPEPATLLLVGVGTAAAGLIRRRSRA